MGVTALGAGLWAMDMTSSGVSARSPLYLLLGFAVAAAVPLLYLLLKPRPKDPTVAGASASLNAAELDVVIRHVHRDLERQAVIAPEHSLALVENDANEGATEGALSQAGAEVLAEGAVTIASEETSKT